MTSRCVGLEPIDLPLTISHLISKKSLNLQFSGGYRSRTDDPLLAKQVL